MATDLSRLWGKKSSLLLVAHYQAFSTNVLKAIIAIMPKTYTSDQFRLCDKAAEIVTQIVNACDKTPRKIINAYIVR